MQLINAGKYMLSVFTGLVQIAQKETSSKFSNFYWFYFCVKFLSTLYNLIWDFKVSWGLFDSYEPGKYLLREKIHYEPWHYYYAMVMNFIIRWWWLLTAF
jgi:hypothetical protein